MHPQGGSCQPAPCTLNCWARPTACLSADRSLVRLIYFPRGAGYCRVELGKAKPLGETFPWERGRLARIWSHGKVPWLQEPSLPS
ncbi:MAG: hypothetical protein [Olavius algarvensis Gamma 1 endosymbiont]|nr:MAG: hypothetical protein [Olavius algarvensis Gamma 1 endosymbiont]